MNFAGGPSLVCALAGAKPVDAMIKLRDKVSMASLAQSVTDPHSPRYGKFFSPDEIRAHAEKFSVLRFTKEIAKAVGDVSS